MLIGLLGLAVPPAGAQPTNCTITSADGGIQVAWTPVGGVGLYVYRLEVAGENNRYNRVPSSATFITLEEGQTGTVYVSGVRADGSYTPSVNCGSGTPNEGTGNPGGGDPTCSITNADGGIAVEWSAVADAATYVYRLDIAGQNPRYRTSDDTKAFIALADGVVGAVRVSAKFANGRYSPAVDCGSGQANEGTGPSDPTCSIEGVNGGVKPTWNAVAGATTYVYRAEIAGQNNRYGRVNATTTTFSAPAGTQVTIAVSAVLADGRYTPAVACGTATAGGNEEPPPVFPAGPAECGIREQATQVFANWSAIQFRNLQRNQAATYLIEFQIQRADGNRSTVSQSVAFPGTSFTSPPRGGIPVETPWVLVTGDRVTATVLPVIVNEADGTSQAGRRVSCGEVVVGGDDRPSDIAAQTTCSLDGKTVTWSGRRSVESFIQIDGRRAPSPRLFVAAGDSDGSYAIQANASSAIPVSVTMFGITPDGEITQSVVCGTYDEFGNNQPQAS